MIAGVLGDLLGLLVGLEHVGEKDVSRAVFFDHVGEVLEHVMKGDDVLSLDELRELAAHAGRGRVDSPGGHPRGDGRPRLGRDVVLQRHVAARVGLGIDEPGNHVFPARVVGLPGRR